MKKKHRYILSRKKKKSAFLLNSVKTNNRVELNNVLQNIQSNNVPAVGG